MADVGTQQEKRPSGERDGALARTPERNDLLEFVFFNREIIAGAPMEQSQEVTKVTWNVTRLPVQSHACQQTCRSRVKCSQNDGTLDLLLSFWRAFTNHDGQLHDGEISILLPAKHRSS
jgi:hypothetical protein